MPLFDKTERNNAVIFDKIERWRSDRLLKAHHLKAITGPGPSDSLKFASIFL